MCQDEDENEDENQSFGSFWSLYTTNEPSLQCLIVLRPGLFVTGFIQNERKLSSSGSFSFSSWHTNNLLVRIWAASDRSMNCEQENIKSFSTDCVQDIFCHLAAESSEKKPFTRSYPPERDRGKVLGKLCQTPAWNPLKIFCSFMCVGVADAAS